MVVAIETDSRTPPRVSQFAITIDQRGLALEVTAPPDALDIVHALFEVPA
jgi:hypothetical protein